MRKRCAGAAARGFAKSMEPLRMHVDTLHLQGIPWHLLNFTRQEYRVQIHIPLPCPPRMASTDMKRSAVSLTKAQHVPFILKTVRHPIITLHRKVPSDLLTCSCVYTKELALLILQASSGWNSNAETG